MAAADDDHPPTSEEEEDDDDAPDLPPPPPASTMRARTSISAEAYGTWNQRAAFTPPVHAKEPADEVKLTGILNRSFLFNSLDAKDVQVVVSAMKGPMKLEPGTQLITEGDAGDALYIIMDGSLECKKMINGENKVVKTCNVGDLFGELALLYDCPRKASVISTQAATVFELDRQTFKHIVMESVTRKRQKCQEVLKKVPLFSALTPTEVENIIDALKIEKFSKGSCIIKQGDEGNHFYIIYEGEVVATKVTEGQEPQRFSHKGGDYFGELALLKNAPRAATVTADSDEVQLLSMDRAGFKRLMGPVEGFLERETSRYG
jgi:cAMP-dependent protein kinase regulator